MKVALIGCYNCNSLGDNMIAYAVKEALAKRISCEVDDNLDNLSRGVIDMTQFDLIILGGGTILGQLAIMPMGYVRQWIDKITCPVIMVGCGYRMGELRGPGFEELMNRIAIKGIRGPVTAKLLKEWEYQDVIVTGDTTLLWDNYQKPHPPTGKVAINPGILELQYANFNDVFEYFVKLTDWLEDEGYKVDFIPFQNEDLVTQDMVKKATKRQTANIIRDLAVPGAAERLADYDLMVGLHLHSFILSYIVGTPALGMEYQFQKAYDFAQTVGLDDYIMGATKLNLDDAKRKITGLLGNDTIVKRTQDRMMWHKGKLEGVLDRGLEMVSGKTGPKVEVKDDRFKILVISTTVFPIPLKGYGGLEQLAYEWAVEFQKAGHQVSVVAPEGSVLPEGMELIPTRLREDEGEAYLRYKDRLLAGEWDCVQDNSWLWYTVIAQMESEDRQLPVVHIYHSDPDFLPNPPPIKHPCLVGLSKDHARRVSKRWQFEVKTCYNGVPLDFYQFDPSIQRNGRWLWCARYTPEKMPLETIRLAKKCNVSLDLYGDTTIIRDRSYLNQCMAECDAKVVFHLEVPREETVRLYQTQKALIHLVSYNEAFGLVPVEAMATGCPVIVNRRGALPELVENGVSGFVVDTLEQAEEIIKSGKVDTISPEACRRQAEKFSIEASARGYLELFREVAAGRVW